MFENIEFKEVQSDSYTFFPGFICRVAGLNSAKIKVLQSASLPTIIDKISKSEKSLDNIREKLSELLFNEISQISETSVKNKIIKLRRDIFNLRDIIPENIFSFFSQSTRDLLKEFIFLKTELRKSLQSFIFYYEDEKMKMREVFKAELKNSDFQKGLLLSSKSLFRSQKIYLYSKSQKLNGKQEQIERGLLKYYSRMVMKATPFGTFCSIIPGKFTTSNPDSCGSLFTFTDSPEEKESIVLINKNIYGNILKFITSDENIKQKLNVEINQTIRKTGDVLYYLTEINGREVFQRLNTNPVLEILYTILNKRQAITFEEITTVLIANKDIDATNKEAVEYLDKLIKIGFLRFKIGIPEQQIDWNYNLLEIISKINTDNAIELTRFLKQINEKINVYKNLTVENRNKTIQEINNLIKQYFDKLNIDKNLRNDAAFYEDATSNAIANIDEKHFYPVKESLINLIRLTRKLALPRAELASMRHFFDMFYKKNEKSVPLLEFYEDYYREHYKEHIEKKKKAESTLEKKDESDLYNSFNPFNIELISKLQSAHTMISNLIVEKWKENPDADEIHITAHELENLLSDIEQPENESASVSVFSQLVIPKNEDGHLRLIINSGKYLLGYGKYFSRFLRLLDSETQKKLYELNNINSKEIVAEISGDANFNANLHPPLTEYEISYPTSEVGMAKQQIKCTDIVVEADQYDLNSLKLFHIPSGKYILPVDLGFMNIMMRPPLYQLFTNFSPPNSFSIPLPEIPEIQDALITENKKSDYGDNSAPALSKHNKVMYRPRIILDNVLVLSRKTWIVPKKTLPSINNDESDQEYFLKINKWRIHNSIPGNVYVKLIPLPSYISDTDKRKENISEKITAEKDKEEEKVDKTDLKKDNMVDTKSNRQENKDASKISRDFYKPQYIDFTSPLLINLFRKMTINLDNYKLIIEERYPQEAELPVYNKSCYCTEQIFQISYSKQI